MQFILLVLASLGLLDSVYLTYKHFSETIVPCGTNVLVDCGAVLGSAYSEVFGIPLALLGAIHYGLLVLVLLLIIYTGKRVWKTVSLFQVTAGLLVSVYLIYIQLIMIGSICLFCMGSAVISLSLFLLVLKVFSNERRIILIRATSVVYQYIIKHLLFQIDAEKVHNNATSLGESVGKSDIAKKALGFAYNYENSVLEQKLSGINFRNPIGLAAGFDYEARLTQVLPSMGFGFVSVGSITNMPYEGNPKPRLGRLPKSKSLLVNKGFKSSGAEKVSDYLRGYRFDIPVGISIGRTNSAKLATQKDSVKDIVAAFRIFEKKKIKNAYYELNISCPNLIHSNNVTFYPPKNLKELLDEVDKLKLKKPVYVKMPIDRTNGQTLAMLREIDNSSMQGVIFSNLQKDKKNPALVKEEVKKFKMGFYSGKPTYQRSNELIKLTYRNYKDRFVIVGCGGVFTAKDAWEKITLGASLVQLITGMVFMGPQIVADINADLAERCKQEGYRNIAEAVGTKVS